MSCPSSKTPSAHSDDAIRRAWIAMTRALPARRPVDEAHLCSAPGAFERHYNSVHTKPKFGADDATRQKRTAAQIEWLGRPENQLTPPHLRGCARMSSTSARAAEAIGGFSARRLLATRRTLASRARREFVARPTMDSPGTSGGSNPAVLRQLLVARRGFSISSARAHESRRGASAQRSPGER